MADEKTFPFEILTLQKLFLQQDARFVIAPGQEGVFEVLPNHAPYVFAIKPGVLRVYDATGNNQYVSVGSGFLVVQKDRTTMLARSAESPEDIDVSRAQKARERAEKRLRENAENLDRARAQAALQRAVARLKVSEYVEREP
jgi:F-type H+-transporting ATPase subunit epsilon